MFDYQVTITYYKSGLIGLSVEEYSFRCKAEEVTKLAIRQLKLDLKANKEELFGIYQIFITRNYRK